MIRLAVMALLLGGLSLAGCTNTVRGLGQDFNSGSMERYNARGGAVVDPDLRISNPDVRVKYESRTATEIP